MLKAEHEDRAAALDAAFEQSLFIHDRPLWKQMFEPDVEEIEKDVEWITRDDPQEFASMLSELREMGVLAD